MSHELYSKFYEVRCFRIKNKIPTDDMPDDPDTDEVMTWACRQMEAMQRVMSRDTQIIVQFTTNILTNIKEQAK